MKTPLEELNIHNSIYPLFALSYSNLQVLPTAITIENTLFACYLHRPLIGLSNRPTVLDGLTISSTVSSNREVAVVEEEELFGQELRSTHLFNKMLIILPAPVKTVCK